MRKAVAITVLALLFAATGMAAEHGVEKVVLASDDNYPDAFLGAAAASNIGSPVLLTDSDELSAETLDAIRSFNASEVVMVGGTAVLSEEVETALRDEGLTVTRLWGYTRYGTAVQVAEHFWPAGADSAILVENDIDDEQGRVLAQARVLAKERNVPILLTPTDAVPEDVLSELQDLGVTSVTTVGTTLSASATDQLDAIGVSVSGSVSADSPGALQRRLAMRSTDGINASETLTVVAAADFRHSIAAANNPNSNAVVIGSADEIDVAVDVVNNRSVSRVRIVGAPDLAEQIRQRLAAETGATLTTRSVQASAAVAFAANFTEQDRERIRQLNQRLQQRQEEDIEQRQEALQRRANRSLNRAGDMVEQYNVSGDVLDELSEARAEYRAGEYLEAFRGAQEVVREIREDRLEAVRGDRAEFAQAIRSELNSLDDEVDDLREINTEFADRMQQNLTVEERLEIINEFKEKRRGAVRDLVEAAQERGRSIMEGIEREQERRSRTTREEYEFTCAEDDAPAPGQAQLSVEGHDGYVALAGMVGLDTPRYRAYAETGRSDGQVTIDVVMKERPGVGVQCTGVAEIEVRERARQGNTSVAYTVTVDGDEVASGSAGVQVGTEDDDDEADDEDDADDGNQSSGSNVSDGSGSQLASTIIETDPDVEDGTVEVSGITRGPAWVVLHRDSNGSAGEVIAHSDLLSEGEFDTEISANLSGDTAYWAMLHNDDGDGEYEFPGDDRPMTIGNETIQQQFRTEAADDGTDNTSSGDDDGTETVEVTYSSDGFSPATVTIDVGDTVRWTSDGSGVWVASDEHPTHAEYDGTSLQEHCGNSSASTFDSCGAQEQYEFTFDRNGSFDYHNHDAPSHTGTVVVEE